ncbi:MAG TPA: hypothetical protein VKZ69_10195 [Limnochordales bacterium]|nr:hypothetical protein [Limnochordales bacterium]
MRRWTPMTARRRRKDGLARWTVTAGGLAILLANGAPVELA